MLETVRWRLAVPVPLRGTWRARFGQFEIDLHVLRCPKGLPRPPWLTLEHSLPPAMHRPACLSWALAPIADIFAAAGRPDSLQGPGRRLRDWICVKVARGIPWLIASSYSLIVAAKNLELAELYPHPPIGG